MRECRCIHNRAFQLFKKMREAGVEPARLAALDPKSSASANFATLASEPRHRWLALFVRYAVYRRSALPTNRLAGGDKAAKKQSVSFTLLFEESIQIAGAVGIARRPSGQEQFVERVQRGIVAQPCESDFQSVDAFGRGMRAIPLVCDGCRDAV